MAKNSHTLDSFASSPEYGDLECFLKICKAENIKPMLIVLPVNGYWYDYTGLTAKKRAVLSKNIAMEPAADGTEYSLESVITITDKSGSFGDSNIECTTLAGKPTIVEMIGDMIFWGPPGVGKTTLARVIAHQTSSAFIDFSA